MSKTHGEYMVEIQELLNTTKVQKKVLKVVLQKFRAIFKLTSTYNGFKITNDISRPIIKLYLQLLKDNEDSAALFSKSDISLIAEHLRKNIKYENKEFVLLIVSLRKIEKAKCIVNNVQHMIENYCSKKEIIELFEGNIENFVPQQYINDNKLYISKNQEWLTVLLDNTACYPFVKKIVTHNMCGNNSINDIIKRLQVIKFQKAEILLTGFLTWNIISEVDVKEIYNMSFAELFNNFYNTTELHINYDNLYNYLYSEVKSIRDDIYFDLINITAYGNSIWSVDARYSKKMFELSCSKRYYNIIIDHLNNNMEEDLDINKNITKLFSTNLDNYKEIANVLKNCGAYDMDIILDNLNFRYYKLDSKFPEFCLNYIDHDLVNLEFLKKFFRLNAYVVDLERFNIPYDYNLYKVCFNYNIFPPLYTQKMSNIKPTGIMIEPNTVYALLKNRLFKSSNVTKLDDEILEYLNEKN